MQMIGSRVVRVAAIVGFLCAAVVLSAHTKLVKSEPAAGAALAAAPKQVQLWFNEKIDPAVSKIELTSAAGKVALGPAHVIGEKSLIAPITGKVDAGSYSIAWQTAGDDGHVIKGEVGFAVKSASTR
ncbi:MAG TPA: copper resistance CopC family protein [Vicinamibacterales bacterium]|nr:copper resistance CopC family protein [Vicinamibacterales bacterium]